MDALLADLSKAAIGATFNQFREVGPDDVADAPAIRLANLRQYLMERDHADVLAVAGSSEVEPPHAALTAREHQVFTLIIQGRTGAEIAAELDLTAGTVSNHVAKIKEKLGAHSLAEIVRYAYRAGLID